MCLLDSNRFARDQAGVSGKLSETVAELGGEVLVSRLFVEQKLAYPINGHRKGSIRLTEPTRDISAFLAKQGSGL